MSDVLVHKSDSFELHRVMVTGATGFVGRYVVRNLLSKGLSPVCLVRSSEKLYGQHPDVDPARLIAVSGSLDDPRALCEAAEQSQAIIHLVGIILARRLRGQSFKKVHVVGTQNVVNAAIRAGIKRLIHMSALGTSIEAKSAYHKTKWSGEQFVIRSGLDSTIFRPSMIHGSDGEFMRLMKRFVCGLVPPVIPYFGNGQAKLQPVSVKDVAFCVVESLLRADTIGKVFPLGGPKAYTWIEFYNACRTLIPGGRAGKPMVSLPVPLAKAVAVASAPMMALAELAAPSIGMFRFDGGQVIMSQHDNVCDHTVAERAFGISMRPFEEELRDYADCIG